MIGTVAAFLLKRPLIAAIGTPLGLGMLVGLSCQKEVLKWWPRLKKPKWAPPAAVFGQVWSILYACMGYASWLVYKQTGWPSAALSLYIVQLLLNLAWQPLFFLAKSAPVAQVENAALLVAASVTAYLFGKTDPTAGWLMVPYVGFVVYANALNYAIMKRNPNFRFGRATEREGFAASPAGHQEATKND